MAYEKYWIKRANQRLADRQKENDKGLTILVAAYMAAVQEISTDVNKYVLQYATEMNVTVEEAKKLLQEEITKNEIKDLMEKVEQCQHEPTRQKLQRKLRTAATQGKINRKQALQTSIESTCANLGMKEVETSSRMYENTYKEEILHNHFDMQRKTGIGYSFEKVSEKQVQEVLKNNWSGKHYSERIWGNQEAFAQILEEKILKGLMTGTNSRKLARELDKITNAGQYACERLIRTETTYFVAMADLKAAEQRGEEEVKFLATLDSRTSPQCQAMDGKIIKISKAIVGKNIPPLHPFCRSVIIGASDKHKIRSATDPVTGKPMTVPANMTYPEWKRKRAYSYEQSNEEGELHSIYVDESKLNTQKYTNKFLSIGKNKDVGIKIRNDAVSMLKHRTGTLYEDIVFRDYDTGEEILRVENRDTERKVTLTKDEESLLISYKGRIVSLHNHPEGTRPSFSDLCCMQKIPNIKQAIVAGHDGSVYSLEDVNRKIKLDNLYEKLYNKVDAGNKDLTYRKIMDNMYTNRKVVTMKEH